MMVRLLKEICKKPGDLKTLLSEAHQELQHLKKQKLEEHFFDNLDLEKWMKQKINQLD
jgi:uncharacterized membrane-anchored protein YhcB (DUF1043 family)